MEESGGVEPQGDIIPLSGFKSESCPDRQHSPVISTIFLLLYS